MATKRSVVELLPLKLVDADSVATYTLFVTRRVPICYKEGTETMHQCLERYRRHNFFSLKAISDDERVRLQSTG